ncbi:hypothetical protein EJO66_16380 [Variovorax beijingensis]|uniref:Uncharacterized protein n=2 Tax=Variovorax beijingensis TaxID=2496117 RepID=A0ABY0A5U7_9BURK|nr:hypothetical protein [Variovorax beijingensis]RSZ35569.1 hypothetical protein EJO66_16380 [Variovorax beijingensis]
MRMVFLYGVAALAACGLCGNAAAQAASQAGDAGVDSCVEVMVNGERAPSYACLTQKLSPAAPPRGAGDPPPGMASEAITQRPSNQLGLFNRAATGHRMGNTFGTSVHPQRPPPVAPSSPLMNRP